MSPYPVHPLLRDDFEDQLNVIDTCRDHNKNVERERGLRARQAAVREKVLAEIQDELWPNSAMQRVVGSSQPRQEAPAPKAKISPSELYQQACSKRALVPAGTQEAKRLDEIIYEFLCDHLHFLGSANLHARRLFIQSDRTSLEDFERAVEGLDQLKERGKEQFLAEVLFKVLHSGQPKEQIKNSLVNIVYGLSCGQTFESLNEELVAEVYTAMF